MRGSSLPAVITAGCKINLYLRITGRLPNGYHTIESLFLPLKSPCDTLTINEEAEEGLRFSCSVPALEENPGTVHAAYEAYARATSFRPGLSVHLAKGIPMGAGLGGGSSDAAAVLQYLQKLAARKGRMPLSMEEMTRLAVGVGADVPFFLRNVPCLAGGIGDILTPVENPFKGLFLLLLCPDTHVSTVWAFKAFDGNVIQNPESGLTFSAGPYSTSLVHGVRLQNDLENVVFHQHRELGKLRDALLAHGALAARMSGSGASLFGLFAEREEAEKAKRFFTQIVSYLHEL